MTQFAEGGLGRSAGVQAGFQCAAIVMTLGFAIVSGLITGFFLKTPFFRQVKEEDMFIDTHNWILPHDFFKKINTEKINNETNL
jgi:ammonium transporter Rh